MGHFYLRLKAKAKSSGATLKTFEGDVRCNWCLVNEEDGRPLSYRLIGRKFDDYLLGCTDAAPRPAHPRPTREGGRDVADRASVPRRTASCHVASPESGRRD